MMKLDKTATLKKLRETVAKNPPRSNMSQSIDPQRQRQVVQDTNNYYTNNVQQPSMRQMSNQNVRQPVQQRNMNNQSMNNNVNINSFGMNNSNDNMNNIGNNVNMNNQGYYQPSQTYPVNQNNMYQQNNYQQGQNNINNDYGYQENDLNFDYSNIETSSVLPFTVPSIDADTSADSIVNNEMVQAKSIRQQVIEKYADEEVKEDYILALVPKNAVSLLQNIKTIEEEDTLAFNGGHYALIKLDK